MAFNTTEAQRNRQLAEDLANKLALERGFKIELSRLLREISIDYRGVLARTGRVLDVREFQTDLSALLRRQYRRVIRKFGSQIRNQTKSFDLRETKGVNEDVEALNRTMVNRQSEIQADLILNTIQGELEVKASQAASGFIDENPQEGLATEAALVAVSLAASKEFNKLIPGKSELISTTEVQNTAEQSKLTEASALAAAGVIIAPKKEWMTIIDSRTRLSHVQADGQVQNLLVPYVVQGQLLRRPGDTSLGASLDNIMNCRCSSVVIFG